MLLEHKGDSVPGDTIHFFSSFYGLAFTSGSLPFLYIRKMKIINIIRRTESLPEGKIISILGWDEKQKKIITVRGKKRFLKRFMEESPFIHKGTGERIKPSHSLKFFKAIPYILTGTYVCASFIKEEK